ncbi:hypothetical protein [Opitutus terrae]|uniref:hypothetical protein n=1 Tax=Opitutus terrae TaxID=107709 RepID=UPI0002F34BEB|nr:hypothetical protein [Opitutus terrae]
MSHDPSRKTFLAKLIGIAAVASLAPRLFAKRAAAAADASTPVKAAGFTLQRESRAVARRADSI